MRSPQKSWLAICVSMVIVISGCGGSGGSTTSSTTSGPAVLSGTAATGGALANAPVTITDSAGNSPCVETSITTSALGAYSCTLRAGETAPFFVVVTDPTGDKPPMVSVSTTTPAAGAALTLNVTPLTTAIVAQLVSPPNALIVVNSRSVDATQLATETGNVLAQLQPVLTSIGAPADYDPFGTSITAATSGSMGNTADLVLDIVKVGTDPAGQPTITTVDNPTPVLLATPTTTGTALPAPSVPLSTLSAGTQSAAQALANCFALPTSSRVLATDTTLTSQQGGPAVTQVATQCQDIVAQSSNGAGMDFLHNGYNAGQFFYGWLTNDSMTGAQFSVPEVMAYYAGSTSSSPGSFASLDRAVLNFRYLDANGNPGNAITVAARIPGTATAAHATDWWVTGNQQTVDTSVKMFIRRVEQLNPSGSPASTFQGGVQFLINPIGPGSVRGGNSLHLARVTGPGLPSGGLTYIVSPNAGQTWMDLWNKTGSLTTGSECGNNGATTNCPLMFLQRTAGITGSAASTLAANPAGMLWAQTADGFNPAAMTRPATYSIELFYGANTGPTADLKVNKTLLTDYVPATQGGNLPWNTAGTNVLALLDPAGSLSGAQTAPTVDWIQNISAQQVGSVTAMTNTTSGTFYSPPQGVPRGATSAVLAGQTVPAFTTTSTRAFLLAYRMLDGSSKSVVYRYN